MNTFKSFETKLYTLNDQSFSDIALELFRFQASENPIYRAFIENLSTRVGEVRTLEQIPFLPISFFKHEVIKTGKWQEETVFTSSGTTTTRASRHAVQNLQFYLQHAQKNFEWFFGPVTDYNFLALLPSYLEREGSSLIAMMDSFVKESHTPYSGFYLKNTEKLLKDLEVLRFDKRRKTILWGVSFALLDLAENHSLDLSPFMIFETGGMKGRRKEITRKALHDKLTNALQISEMYSEYGMTELLSQAYTKGGHRFYTPPWMKVIGRDLTDPFHKGLQNETAGINVIDLANWHSIAFIETEDLGKVYEGGSFEVLGRLDNSDIRGCNLLIE